MNHQSSPKKEGVGTSGKLSRDTLQKFVDELSGFQREAEAALKRIEANTGSRADLFSIFTTKMVAIRGTAEQLQLKRIAEIAELGEEIAIKGSTVERNSQVRKCIGSLWDALTTVRYLLMHWDEETSEEQKILVHRLNATIKAFGGRRPTIENNEIQHLLKQSKTRIDVKI